MTSSRADAELIAALGKRDVRVTTRQLDRWRRYGVIATERCGAGRGCGSTSRYWPGTDNTVVALVTALGRCRQLDAAVLALFDEGAAVPEIAVKRAYANSFARLRRAVRRPSESRAKAAERLERGFLRTVQGRTWRRQLRRAGYGDNALRRVIAALADLALDGHRPGSQELELIAEASGLAPLGRALASIVDGCDWGSLAYLLDLFNLQRLERATGDASLAELQLAMQRADAMFALASPAVAVLGGIAGFADAKRIFGVDHSAVRATAAPTLLVLAELADVEAAAAQTLKWQPQFDALAAVIAALPFWYGQLFAPNGIEALEALSQGQQEHVLSRIRAVLETNPEAVGVMAASSSE